MTLRAALELLFLGFAFSAAGCGGPERSEPYPLGPESLLLEKDVSGESYPNHLQGFHVNDLKAEWERLNAPDNFERFAAEHGGVEKLTDPALLEAYDRRQRIAERFLSLLRGEYARRGEKIPAEAGAALEVKPARAAGVSGPELPIEAILPAPGAERQWPRWRGPTGQGLTAETGLPAAWTSVENIAWKTEIPGAGNSSPVIWDDRIFLTSAFEGGKRRSLICLRREDGEMLYVRDAPSVPAEGHVRDKNGYASATPVVDGERVVVFLGNSGLLAFDLSGGLFWHHPLPPFDGMHGTGASPILCGDLAILFQEQSNKPSLGVALDKRTGEERWRMEAPSALGWCTPLPVRVGGKEQLLYGASQRVVSFDPRTGHELWRCSGPTIEVIPTVVCGQGLVVSSSGRNGPTVAVRPDGSGDVSATHLAWRAVRGAPHVPSPVLSGELFYQVNDTGIVSCLEARTGAIVYQKRLEGRFTASPVLGDGKIYFTNEDGETFVVREGREFAILGTNPLSEPTLASAAILGGRIFLRTNRHLFAIGKTSSERTALR
jgi:outer membrane protein assembly factor BamB